VSIFQNKNKTKSKQNQNKIKTKTQQNHNKITTKSQQNKNRKNRKACFLFAVSLCVLICFVLL